MAMATGLRLKLYILAVKIIILVFYFNIWGFPVKEAVDWENADSRNADTLIRNTSVTWDEEEEIPKPDLKHEYDRSSTENMIGGPSKIFDYFRDHVFKKKCLEENEEYSEAEAEEAWREMSETERRAVTDEALIFNISDDYMWYDL